MTATILELVKPGSPKHRYGNAFRIIDAFAITTKKWSGVDAGSKVIVKDINLTPGNYTVTVQSVDGARHFFPADYLVPETK